MEPSGENSELDARVPWKRHRGKLLAGIVALVVLASAAYPIAVVLTGVLLVALVAVDSLCPGLVPGLRALFRVPVYPRSTRRLRLALAAAVGVVLVACGTTGARLGTRLRTEHRLDQRAREASREHLTALLARARAHVSAGEVGLAALTLADARELARDDPERAREVDQLLDQVRRSGDPDAIRELLVGLPQDEFEAFAARASVPDALDFYDRALTRRAVELAYGQLDQARAERAGP